MKKALNTLILFIAVASMTCFSSCTKSKESMALQRAHLQCDGDGIGRANPSHYYGYASLS